MPSNPPGQSLIFICLSLAVWLCLKKCSEKRVMVVLLQVGAKDHNVKHLCYSLIHSLSDPNDPILPQLYGAATPKPLEICLPLPVIK